MPRTRVKVTAKAKNTAEQRSWSLVGRAKNLALAGLFLSMGVSMLSMSVIGTSMPAIIADLGGNQATFTWVASAQMLSFTLSTPIWGKLADLMSKKLLMQLSLVFFALGSALAGMATDPSWMIAFRVLQGIGAGGIPVLGQIVMAEILSPRDRGKYAGIMGAVMTIAMVGGPVLGGFITDGFGWRWNFYVAPPLSIVAIIMLQRTLKIATRKRTVKIDYWGIFLITSSFSSLLVWVTIGGTAFDWVSWESLAMAGGGLVLLLIAVLVELKVDEPLIPLTLFTNRTFTLAVIASLAVGLAMFTTSTYLGQYMQLARGKTPGESGLLTIPMMAGVLLSSSLVGQLVSRFGKWKAYVVSGSTLTLTGLIMLGQLRYDTSFWYVGISMFVLGVGVGMCIQNLVLVVQNTADPHQMGAASSAVIFFRSVGGTVSMSAMGALLAFQVSAYLQNGLAKLTPEQLSGADVLTSGIIPKIADLPGPLRPIAEAAYGHGIGDIFFAATPLALIALIAVLFLPNIPLGTKSNAQLLAEQVAENERAARLSA